MSAGRAIGPAGWLRIILRALAMIAALALAVPAFYVFKPFTRRNPVPRRFLAALGRISGMTVRRTGPAPQPGSFLIANHVSWLDIPALAGATGSAFVAHDGLAAFAPLRWLCDKNDTVFIARHDRASVTRQIEQVRAALAETGALTVFPEGTTSDGTGLLPFKSALLSALETDADHVPVQPVWLDYGREVADIAWVGVEPGLDNALRVLARRRPVTLTLHFLLPLEPAARANRKTMAKAAQDAIQAAIDRPA
ncbi:lysophospholipid acyltransferase family protein [Novosphingobium colocasiae]|uniref:Phospholipid/glycerol acyltransferase domain-containing protein n=1 Tax=Novosphingobium colocasiae TaxID=1256513 RepID=A0A918PH40_9SPHN|nr:lysophospholipid acyltransferase family protein [Novosphingobium colocasiae]GGZ06018.1 hypothetical protein GCM10011614_21100 [Novosphingobium colocasiae]